MTIERLSKKLYNPEFKKVFLDQYDNDGTRETIENALAIAQSSEEVLGKDLYDFTLDEIGQVIKAANPMNYNSAYVLGRHIYRYILFAKSMRKSNIHPMDGISPEWYRNWVSKNKKYLFSKLEIEDIIFQLENDQDKAMIALLFEGAGGQRLSELSNLRKEDVNQFRNEITLHDDKDLSVRVITISTWCMDLVQKAMKSNGYKTRSRVGNDILGSVMDNDYVFRPLTVGRAKEKEPIAYSVLYSRISTIRKQLDLPYLRFKGLQQSGMIYMAYRLWRRDKVLKYKQFEEIAKKYNTGNYVYGLSDVPYLNTSILKQFINEENIMKLYHVDINKNN